MSNLIKSGFQSFATKQGDVFVFDANSRIIETVSDTAGRVIRPVEEGTQEPEDTGANEAMLNDAMDKARLLHDDARVRAARIISEAEQDAEKIKEQAYKDGYERGLAEGNTEAMKRADEYLENINNEKESELAEAKKQMESELADAEEQMLDLACGLISKLTGILVEEYKPVMLYMINEALNKSDTSKKYVIHVADELYSYIEDNKSRLFGAANPGISIEIFGDSKLEKGACRIDTDNGIIDLSMDVQVKKLITAIKLLSE